MATSHAVEGSPKKPGEQAMTLFMLVIPFGLPLVLALMNWPLQPSPLDLFTGFVFFLVTGFGVTVGFHRYLTHRSFKTNKVLRVIFAIAGSLAVEGPVISWVANHNKHHAFSDEEGDPHSPHVGHDNLAKGMWHAHWGWLIKTPTANKERFARELINDPAIVWIDRLFLAFVVATFVLPFVIGWLATGTLDGAIRMFFWAGVVRMGITHHVTWSINSVCHTLGTTQFKTKKEADHSTNVWWLRWITLGESNHHNHHAFPTSAIHGLRKGESDPSGRLIQFLEKLRLVKDVVRPKPEEVDAKLIDRST